MLKNDNVDFYIHLDKKSNIENQIQRRDDIIPALALVLEKNERLTTIQLDSIKTQPRVFFCFPFLTIDTSYSC